MSIPVRTSPRLRPRLSLGQAVYAHDFDAYGIVDGTKMSPVRRGVRLYRVRFKYEHHWFTRNQIQTKDEHHRSTANDDGYGE